MARVLIVDDEESIRITLAEFIKEDGYVIETAADAAEALRLMDKQAFDVIVTDIVLPRMNGVVLMKKIREKSPDTQVIMLTGDPSVGTAAEAVRTGAFDYLTKPVTKSVIQKVVANAAHVKALTNEKRELEESNKWYQNHLEELVEKRTTALKESEARYRATFQSTGTAMLIMEEDMTISMVNKQAEKLSGYSLEGKMRWTDFVAKEDLERMKAYHKARRTEGESAPSTYEFHLVDRQGETRNILLTIGMIAGTKRSIASMSDVTELKNTERALQESESRYRDIVHYQTECIDRWLPDGTLTFVNDAYCKYYGKSRKELIGSNWIDVVAKEDRKEIQAYMKRSRASVTPQDPISVTEHREIASDGKTHWMEWTDQAIFDEQGKLTGFQSVGKDVTKRKKAQEEEEQLLQQQSAMNRLSLALSSSTSLQSIYETVYKYVAELIATDAFYISSYDKTEQLIRAEYVRDEYGHVVDTTTLPPLNLEKPGYGTQSQVIRSGKPMYIPDIFQFMEDIQVSYDIAPDGTVTKDTVPYAKQEDVLRSELLSPMLLRGEVTGVIGVESKQVDAYTQTDLDLLSGLANVAAVAIENAHLQEHLKKTLGDTIRVVGLTTEMRDPYTARHQERVTNLACAIAREMSIPEGQIEGIHAAGLMHDIGKIAIPAEILTKPSQLSELEFQLIRRHPEVAYSILKNVEFPWPIAQIVLQHHERMDGSGYPNGLKGDQILLEARILAVADVVEAMSSHRPYRAALGLDAALDEIKQGKGRLYDPDVVDACLALFEKGFTFE
ncbi:MAG: PAS domain S-box protein [Candidatus Bipolaricaulota bacterium]|nr:PAS domain S-box protein [Candidatus Bipolaricaulota bacterium]